MESVIKCEKVKEWTNKDGKAVPIYLIGLSDGQGGESFGVEIPIGTPMEQLKIEASQYGNKIKWNKPGATGGFGGGRQQRAGNESFAMSYAKDIVVGGKAELKNLLPLADNIYNWLEKKKEVAAPIKETPKVTGWPTAVNETPKGIVNSNDDSLSF